MGLIGQAIASAANARENFKNRQFQERMSNSAYQRSVVDMKAAGLNPIVMYGQGGGGSMSSSPSGNAGMPGASSDDIGGASISSAVSMALQGKQKEQVEAGTEKIRAETRLIDRTGPTADIQEDIGQSAKDIYFENKPKVMKLLNEWWSAYSAPTGNSSVGDKPFVARGELVPNPYKKKKGKQ